MAGAVKREGGGGGCGKREETAVARGRACGGAKVVAPVLVDAGDVVGLGAS